MGRRRREKLQTHLSTLFHFIHFQIFKKMIGLVNGDQRKLNSTVTYGTGE